MNECNEKKHCAKCGEADDFSSIADVFWATCEWNGDCLEWNGTICAAGYGVLSANKRQWRTHRIAKALSGEFVPHWLVIDHLCKNRACQNPAHLRVCTNIENVMAGDSGPAKNALKDKCINGHEFAKHAKLVPNRKNRGSGGVFRECRICKAEHRRNNPKIVAKDRERSLRYYYAHAKAMNRANTERKRLKAQGDKAEGSV